MNSAIERLLTLRVRDVMHNNVVSVNENATMGEAAELLQKHDITGAPVVDVVGKCIGVLSASDFARREKELSDTSESFGGSLKHTIVQDSTLPICVEAVRENRVGEHMSPLVQTISADAPILQAGRILVGEHIHRLIVIDENERPSGVLSSLDLVACMIAAVEE